MLSLGSRIVLTSRLRSVKLPGDNLSLLWVEMIKLDLILVRMLLILEAHILHLLLLILVRLKWIILRYGNNLRCVIKILRMFALALTLIRDGARVEEMLR